MDFINRFNRLFGRRRRFPVWVPPPMDPKARELRALVEARKKRHVKTAPLMEKLRAHQAARLRGD